MPRTPEGKAADRRTKSGIQTQSSWMAEKVKKMGAIYGTEMEF